MTGEFTGQSNDPSPEIVAAVIAVLSAITADDGVPETRSRWLARTRPFEPRWQPGNARWLKRARLNAVERERRSGY